MSGCEQKMVARIVEYTIKRRMSKEEGDQRKCSFCPCPFIPSLPTSDIFGSEAQRRTRHPVPTPAMVFSRASLLQIPRSCPAYLLPLSSRLLSISPIISHLLLPSLPPLTTWPSVHLEPILALEATPPPLPRSKCPQ